MNLGVNSVHLPLCDPHIVRQQVEAMVEAGIKWCRISLPWPDLEPTPGAWDFTGADYAVLALENAGIDVLAVIGGSPPWANGNLPFMCPPLPEFYQDWRTYCRYLQNRYPQVACWEVWNEQNTTAFFAPVDHKRYVELLYAASVTIIGKVIMGGVAGLDPTYLENCFKAGALSLVDGVAYHPYPETLYPSFDPVIDAGWWIFKTRQPQDSFATLTKLVKKYAADKKELWATEIGWTSSGLWSVTEAQQAEYLKRALSAYRSLGLDYFFYFNLWDANPWPWDRESNYGLLRYDFSKKAAFAVYR